MVHTDPLLATQVGHLSAEARLLTGCCGLALFGWSLLKLRRRSALVPTCSLFLTVGLLFLAFTAVPDAFDRMARWVGVQYPPVLYLIGGVFVLIMLIVHLATRLSTVDERCRRLAQELALLQSRPSGRLIEFPRRNTWTNAEKN